MKYSTTRCCLEADREDPVFKFKEYADGKVNAAQRSIKNFEEKVPVEHPHAMPMEVYNRVLAFLYLELRKGLLSVRLNQRKRTRQ